ncbi:FAD/NAD(P)-binding domain-containing protein [Hypoxylon sp. FL1284]|nr:FAD/NAD(P)-binding domain-containing protein [Hypoxylon sp. FL1284]
MKILINGAGIAGNALAFWLSKSGHKVTVVEWFSTLRATGLQIDLRGPGVEVLRRMGLEEAFRAKAAPEVGFQVVDGAGKRCAYFPANKSGKGVQSLTSDHEIMRGDLCRLFRDAVGDRAEYLFGTTIESFEQKEGGEAVDVRFSDGRTDSFDLVVGADGQWSKTRRMMLGADTPDPIYPLGGVYAAYFTIPRPIQEGEGYMATMFLAPGKRGLFLRRHSPDRIQVYLGCTRDMGKIKDVRRGDTAAEKEALAEVYEGVGWQAPAIIEAMRATDDFYCERMCLVKLETWSRGRAALVGDAAYCPTVTTGMGTTCAVAGAYILAGELARHCKENSDSKSVKAALRAYEDKFRPFMDTVQKDVAKDSGTWSGLPTSPLGIWAMNRFLGLLSFLKIDLGKWLIKEEAVKDWKLPEYAEMS